MLNRELPKPIVGVAVDAGHQFEQFLRANRLNQFHRLRSQLGRGPSALLVYQRRFADNFDWGQLNGIAQQGDIQNERRPRC